jgi:hypothetical protein
MKNLKVNTEAKSLVYLFYENEPTSIHYKIGFTSHFETDDAIKNWKRYTDSDHPVSIQRRIIQFQTGSPRQIKPLAYFLYSSKKDAKTVEKTLQNHFKNKKSEYSKEWFKLSAEEIIDITICLKDPTINKIAINHKAQDFWVDENKMNELKNK